MGSNKDLLKLEQVSTRGLTIGNETSTLAADHHRMLEVIILSRVMFLLCLVPCVSRVMSLVSLVFRVVSHVMRVLCHMSLYVSCVMSCVSCHVSHVVCLT